MIPRDKYINIIGSVPVLCVDLVLVNNAGKYLLVKRCNEPLKGEWWVIGGRVHKGETIQDAGIRKAKQELSVDICDLIPVGYFEAPFQKHPFGLEPEYHAVSIVMRADIKDEEKIRLDSQSLEWKFSDNLPNLFIVNKFTNCLLSNKNPGT
jgi:colanic acid biosynthesis protein WcaH